MPKEVRAFPDRFFSIGDDVLSRSLMFLMGEDQLDFTV
jgi:hypothetical protein